MTNWRRIVIDFARKQGAPSLPSAVVDELAEHLEDVETEARAAGHDPDVARRLAIAKLEESTRAAIAGLGRRASRVPRTDVAAGVKGASPLRSLSIMQAFRLALRQFAHHRSFTLVTILVLGLGIGASVSVYSVVDGVLLRPLPFAEPDALVSFWDTNHERGLTHEPMSPVNFMDYRELDAFTDAAAWWRPDVNLVDPGQDPVRVRTIETGANLMSVLGVFPQLGPGFPADEPYFASQPRVAVISDRLWRTRYERDPEMIGKLLELNGTPYSVVGVMPPGFDYPGDIDVWQRSSWDFTQHSRGAHFMEGVARLAPGVTMEEATSAVSGLSQRLENDFAQTNKAWGVRLIPVLDEQLGYYQPAIIVLFGAVGLLMVIGCLNVASLLLTRALSREREIAVRTALGASPRHLIVQLLAEALVLSVGGALVGTLAAWAALPLMVSATQVDIPRLDEVAINLRVLGFALLLAVGTTVVFGLVPAITLIRRSLTADLKTGDRGSSKASRTIYKGLVVGEVALACALLIGSGLLVGTVARMMSVPLGVGNPSVVTSSIQLSGSAYPDWGSVNTSHSAILEHLRLQPGIRAAGAANFLPLEAGWRVSFAIDGEVPAQASDLPQAQFHSVSEGHFEAIGARLVSGRFITDRDRPEAIGAVVVNQAFADRYLRTTDRAQPVLLTAATGIGPLGFNVMPQAPIEIGGSAAQVSRFDIVGVVADIRNVPLGQEVEPAVYFSARQFPFRAMFLTIDAPDVGTAVTALRNTLRAVAPGIPLTDALTWQDRFRVQTAEPRLLMTVLVFFGSLAALLAALGVYGLFSWTVALRQRELAIRLTLGARPMAIGASVLRQGTLLIVVGLALGWAIVQLAAPALRQVLFDMTANDPGAVALAFGLLLVASVGACLPPAIRAMRVNPIDGLRD